VATTQLNSIARSTSKLEPLKSTGIPHLRKTQRFRNN